MKNIHQISLLYLATLLSVLGCAAPQGTSQSPPALPQAAPTDLLVATALPQPAGDAARDTARLHETGTVVISMQAAPSVPPDVPQHLSFGAFFYVASPAVPEDCVDIDNPPEISLTAPITEVMLPQGTIDWCYTNLHEPEGTEIVANLIYPDSAAQAITGTVSEKTVMFQHRFQADDPDGVYTFTAELSGRGIVDSFIPGIGVTLLPGWQADEPVRILVYDDELQFRAEARAQADATGMIRLKLVGGDGKTFPYSTLVAIGKVTGCLYNCERYDPDRNIDGGAAFVVWNYDSPRQAYRYVCYSFDRGTQLDLGIHAIVAQELSRIPVRSAPGQDNSVVGDLMPGEEVVVEDGPYCGEDAFGWRVRSLSNDLSGWTMESEGDEAWLVRKP